MRVKTKIRYVKHYTLNILLLFLFSISFFSPGLLQAGLIQENNTASNKNTTSAIDQPKTNNNTTTNILQGPTNETNTNNSSLIIPDPGTGTKTINGTKGPAIQPKTSSQTATTGTSGSTSESTSNTQNVRVDYNNYVQPSAKNWQTEYNYKPIYPEFYLYKPFSNNPSQTCFGIGLGAITSVDGYYTGMYARSPTTVATAYGDGCFIYYRFDVTGLYPIGSIASGSTNYKNIYYQTNAMGTIYTASITENYPNGDTWTYNIPSGSGSKTNITDATPYVIGVGNKAYIEGFFNLNGITDGTVNANHDIAALFDSMYFQPSSISNTQSAIPTNPTNGKYQYSTTVNPVSNLNSVTIHNTTNTQFIGSSNSYYYATTNGSEYFTDVLGTPMDFSTGLQGWTNYGSITPTVSNGKMQLVETGAFAGAIYVFPQPISTKVYSTLSFDISATQSMYWRVFLWEVNTGGVQIQASSTGNIAISPTEQTLTFQFSDFSTLMSRIDKISLETSSSLYTGTVSIDNVKIQSTSYDYATHNLGHSWSFDYSSDYFKDVYGTEMNFTSGTSGWYSNEPLTNPGNMLQLTYTSSVPTPYLQTPPAVVGTIPASIYKYSVIEVKATAGLSSISIQDLSGNQVCSTSSVSANVWSLATCTMTGLWSGTEDGYNIFFHPSSAPGTIYVNFIGLFDSDKGNTENWLPTNMYNYVDPQGYLVNHVTTASAPHIYIPALSIDTSNYIYLTIKIKSSSASSLAFGIYSYPNGYSINGYIGVTNSFQVFTTKLSGNNNWALSSTGIQLYFWQNIAGTPAPIDSIYTIDSISLTNGNTSTTIYGLPSYQQTTLTFQDIQAITTSQTVNTIAYSSYQTDGRFINTLTVNPNGSSVTIYNSSNWIFSGASNYYSSMTVSNYNTILTGLPIRIDTIVTFISDYSARVDSITPYLTIDDSGTNSSYQFMGKSSTYISNSQLNVTNIPLNYYAVRFDYYAISTGSIDVFYNGSSSGYSRITSTIMNDRWNNFWFFVNPTSYYQNNIIQINITGSIYYTSLSLYVRNQSLSNNHNSGLVSFSGYIYYLTSSGLKIVSATNISLNWYSSNSITYTLLETDWGLTDSQGYITINLQNQYSNGTYYFGIKTNLKTSLSSPFYTYNDGFEATSLSQLQNEGWAFNTLSGSSLLTLDTNPSDCYSGNSCLQGTTVIVTGYAYYTPLNIISTTVGTEFKLTEFIKQGDINSFPKLAFNYPNQHTCGISFGFGSSNSLFWCGSAPSWSVHTFTTSGFTYGSWVNITLYVDVTSEGFRVTGYYNNVAYLSNYLFPNTNAYYPSGEIGTFAFGVDDAGSVSSHIDDASISYKQGNYVSTSATELYTNTQLSYSITESSGAYILSQNSLGGDIYGKVWIDNIYQGLYSSSQVIYKIYAIGTHTFSFLMTGSNDYVLSQTTFVNATYTYTNAEIETLVFRDQQGKYINPDTFNVYANNQRIVGGSFYVTDTSQSFNLTITDAWNSTVYQNTAEMWTRIKDLTITLYSLKIQNFQTNPVYVDIKRYDSQANFSEWVFPQEVIEYKLLPTSYNLTYNYAYVNSSFVSQTNGTWSHYDFTIGADLAFRITGTSLQDIYSNVLQTIIDVASANETIKSQVNILQQNLTIQFDASNSQISIIAGNLSLVKSMVNGNFSIFTNSLKFLNSTLNANISIITGLLNIIDSMVNANFTVYTNTMAYLNSTLNANFTVFTDSLNFIYDSLIANFSILTDNTNFIQNDLNANFTIFTNTLKFLNSTINANFTIFTDALNIINSMINGNLSFISNSVNITKSWIVGNWSILTDSLNFIQSDLNANFTVFTTALNVINSMINGNFSILTNNFAFINSSLKGNFSIITGLLNIINSNAQGNFSILTGSLNILNSIVDGNFSIIAQDFNVLQSVLDGNFTILSEQMNGNFTLVASLVTFLQANMTGNFSAVFDNFYALNSTLAGNFTAIVSQMNLINGNLTVGFLDVAQAFISNTTFLQDQLNANFSLVGSLFGIYFNSNTTTIYNQTISLLNKIAEISGIYRVHFTLVDELGLGLPWETVLITVNQTRQLDQDLYLQNNTFIEVNAFDYYNVHLFLQDYTISKAMSINITVKLYQVIFRNNGNFTSYLTITRNNRSTDLKISPNQDISVRMTEGDYDISINYYKDELQTDSSGSQLGDVADYGKTLYKTDSVRVSTQLPQVIDASTPTVQSKGPGLSEAIQQSLTSIALVSVVIGTIIGIVIREVWIAGKVTVLKRAPEDSLIVPDWVEKREEYLDREMQSRPQRYEKSKGYNKIWRF